MRAFEDDDHNPFFWKNEYSRVALLIHGFPGTPKEMRDIGKILHQNEYDVKGILLPGFGKDIKNLISQTRDNWQLYLREEIDQLVDEYSSILIVGYSFGAALTLSTIDYIQNKIDKLILIAPFWDTFGPYNRFLRFFGHLLWPLIWKLAPPIKPYKNADFDNESTREQIKDNFTNIDLDNPDVRQLLKDIKVPMSTINELYQIGKSAYSRGKNVNIPILILQGEKDLIVPEERTRKLSMRINPTSYKIITGANHTMIMAEEDIFIQLNNHIISFLH